MVEVIQNNDFLLGFKRFSCVRDETVNVGVFLPHSLQQAKDNLSFPTSIWSSNPNNTMPILNIFDDSLHLRPSANDLRTISTFKRKLRVKEIQFAYPKMPYQMSLLFSAKITNSSFGDAFALISGCKR